MRGAICGWAALGLLLAGGAWIAGCSGSLAFEDDDSAAGDDDGGDDDAGDDDAGDDDGGDDDASGSCEDVAVVFDFEAGDQGFTHGGVDSGFDDPWELGAASGGGTCHSGTQCWATRLAGEYGDCESGEVISPVIDLSPCAGEPLPVDLRFAHTYRFEEEYQGTYFDGGLLQISADGGTSWDDVAPVPGYTAVIQGNYSECPGYAEIDGMQAWSGVIPGGPWEQVNVPVGDAHRTAEFRVRFLFGSDRSAVDLGWTIDDVEIAVTGR